MGRLSSFDAWAELPLKEVLVPPASTEGQREDFKVLALPKNQSCSITVTTAGGRGSRREGHWARKFSSSRPLAPAVGGSRHLLVSYLKILAARVKPVIRGVCFCLT